MDIDNLVNNIVKISIKKTNEEVAFSNIRVEKIANKYSSTKVPIWKLSLDGKILGRNNPYRVTYKCFECDRENIINLELFVRKLNKNITKCNQCRELDQEKRSKHSDTLIKISSGELAVKSKTKIVKTIEEKIESSKLLFDSMDSDFQDQYWLKHLTPEEFNLIRPKILSFQRGKYQIQHFEYCPTITCNNQAIFSPKVYNREKDILENIDYIEFKCDLCLNKFVNRDLWTQKNKIKQLCQDCKLSNSTFKIRSTKNYIKDNIIYQSQLELKFIRFCNDHKIIVNNGPTVLYNWNDKIRNHKIDFMIPELNILVETKDDHCWHRTEIANGKWQAKQTTIDQLLKNEIYKEYMLIFAKDYVSQTKLLLEKFSGKA